MLISEQEFKQDLEQNRIGIAEPRVGYQITWKSKLKLNVNGEPLVDGGRSDRLTGGDQKLSLTVINLAKALHIPRCTHFHCQHFSQCKDFSVCTS